MQKRREGVIQLQAFQKHLGRIAQLPPVILKRGYRLFHSGDRLLPGVIGRVKVFQFPFVFVFNLVAGRNLFDLSGGGSHFSHE